MLNKASELQKQRLGVEAPAWQNEPYEASADWSMAGVGGAALRIGVEAVCVRQKHRNKGIQRQHNSHGLQPKSNGLQPSGDASSEFGASDRSSFFLWASRYFETSYPLGRRAATG